MKSTFEKTYGKVLKGMFFVVNPVKKRIIKTYCVAHKYICIQSMKILKNEGYCDEYCFYRKYVNSINSGVMWADQDFKSSNHFYHFEKERGLYGFSDALTECRKYYNSAKGYIDAGDMEKGMFYFGAACHLLQDATVPQHVNNKLLKNHREFEQWIIKRLSSAVNDFSIQEGITQYDTIDDYIKNNAVKANSIYKKYAYIKDINGKYTKMASESISTAEKTTAGFMLRFYNEAIKK